MADSPFPAFDKPPVVEAIMGIFFASIGQFNVLQRSLFWERSLSQDFPIVQEQPPLDEVREDLTENWISASGPQIRWQTHPPSPKIWAKSSDGKHTIQIQQDALIANWERNLADHTSYIQYADRKRSFLHRIGQLADYLQENGLEGVCPTSCFVTYINHFELEDGATFSSTMDRVLRVWRDDPGDWLPPVERSSFTCSFRMPDQLGRLNVTANPAMRRRDGRFMVRLELTARGSLKENTVEHASSWLDIGHEWVVNGFDSLTSKDMHRIWGKH